MEITKEEDNLRSVFAYFTTYHIAMCDNLNDNKLMSYPEEISLREEFEKKCWNKFYEKFPQTDLEDHNNIESGFCQKLISIVEKEISELKYKKRT